MEELCQPTLNGRGGPIAPIAIQATNFRLKNDMIQQVQNSCKFHGLPGDDANKHLDKFLHVTQSIKVNGVTDDALRLYLFPHSLTHHVTAWFDHSPRNSINTFEQMDKMFLEKYFPPSMVTKLRNEITNFRGTFMKRRPKECYDLIENMTAHHNDWDTSAQRTTVGQTHNVYAAGAYNQGGNSYQPQGASHGQNPPPAYQAPGYQAPVHQAPIPQPQVMTTTAFTNYMKANDVILKNMQTNMTSMTNSNLELKNMFGQFMKMNTASSSGSRTLPSNTITNPKEDLKGITTQSGNAYKGPMFPTSSSPLKVMERKTEMTKDMMPPTNNGSTRDVQPPVVQIETLIPNSEPVVAPIVELLLLPLLTNKEKLYEIARTSLNEHYSAVLLKKLPEKLGDPDRLISRPVGVAEDVFVKVGTFHFLADFVVVDFDADPRVSLILERSFLKTERALIDVYEGELTLRTFHFLADFVVVDFDADPRVSLILERSFLKTERALIDVYEGELTLRVGKKSVTFNLDQTSRYSANYDVMSVNRIDLIDVACEEYSQEVLGFSMSDNPTPSTEPIISNSSLTLTPFGDSDFLLEETDAFLAIDDDPISPKIDDRYYDSEGDILLLDEFLNDDPSSLPLPPQELNVVETTNEKSSIDEPPVVELKDLSPHLEYAFLEGDDKLPVIIEKDLKDEEKTALTKDDFKPAVHQQRRVNPKIHEVIKKEVLKLLDAELIYPISDSPWVSPVHCVPKKYGFTVVENEENELIPTRLVTGWYVCIDYRNLNDATCKDHFSLPFMDQMLERLVGNEYYYFLDGFLGYFQIPIDPQDQENTTFTCPYGTFAYRRMPFGLSNAPGTFQRCMMAIFHDMIEKTMEVFMDDFSVFGNSFRTCLSHWEKSHFMVKEGIVLGHKISKNGIEGIDFMGSFPSSRGNKYILLAVDYLLKWVEAKTLPTNDARVVCKFLKSLFARFGTPRTIISDRGENRASWLDKLDGALWAFRTAFKTPIGCTPYKLVYGKACHLPIELEHKAYWALKHCNYDLLIAGDHHKVQLNELNELRDQAYENSLIYKEKSKTAFSTLVIESSSLILD
nr:reverse transcriptase domain-containing protein [Tanacetum cinerariifolium]